MLAALAPLVGAGISGLFGMLGSKRQSDQSAAIARQNMIAQQQANERNIQFTQEQNALNRASQENINARILADKETDRALQREFASSGIQWRVDDARAAGIHPIYALGGSGASYSPSAIQLGVAPQAVPQAQPIRNESVPSSNWLGSFGQDIGRAINATRTALERDNAYETSLKALQLRNMKLQGDLLSSQIAKNMKASPNPPFPVPGSDGDGVMPQTGPIEREDAFKKIPRLMMGNGEIVTDPRISSAQEIEDRYGEFIADLYGAYVGYRDYMYSTNGYGPLYTLGRDWQRMRSQPRQRPPATGSFIGAP